MFRILYSKRMKEYYVHKRILWLWFELNLENTRVASTFHEILDIMENGKIRNILGRWDTTEYVRYSKRNPLYKFAFVEMYYKDVNYFLDQHPEEFI